MFLTATSSAAWDCSLSMSSVAMPSEMGASTSNDVDVAEVSSGSVSVAGVSSGSISGSLSYGSGS